MKYTLFPLLLVFLWACSPEDEFLSSNLREKDVEIRLNDYWDLYDAHKVSNRDSALYYMQEVKILAEAADKPKWLAAAYMAIGHTQYKEGLLGEATYNYLNAIELYKELEELKRLASTYNNLALVYEAVEDYKTAIQYSLLAKDIFFYEGISNEKANNYRNLALYYSYLEQFDEAEKYLHLSEKVALEAQDSSTLALIYNTTGAINFKQEKYDLAREYYHMAIQYSDSSEDGLWIKAAATNNTFETYVYEKEYQKAEEWLHKAIARKTELNDPAFLQSTLNLFAEMLMEQGKYKEAIDLLQDNFSQIDLTETNPSVDEGLRMVQEALAKIATENNPDNLAYLFRNFAINNNYAKTYTSHTRKLSEQLEIYGQQQAIQANLIKYVKNEEIKEVARKNLYIILIAALLLLCATVIIILVVRRNRKYKTMYSKIENVLNNSKLLQHLR